MLHRALPPLPTGSRAPSGRRSAAAGDGPGGLTLAVSAPATARGTLTAGEGQRSPLPPAAPGVVRITQANLLSGQPALDFQADAATVLSNQPDFITYNEVPYRHDIFLAPPGYAMWRTPGEYTGATPVAWRTDRWTAINQGTTTVSYKGGRLPGQKVEWGIRYANWVDPPGHRRPRRSR